MPRVNVTIAIPPGQAGAADRYRYAALTTLKILGTWLTPFPDPALSVVADRTPWWTAPASMAPEYAAARAISRAYWERMLGNGTLGAGLVDGLSEYAARRAVSKIVDERYRAVYRGRLEGRYFGGFVPRDLRVQLPVEDDGPDAFLALGTLERLVGRPVFDAILAEFMRVAAAAPPTIDDFAAVASRVSGQDLAGFVDATLKRRHSYDYAVQTIESEPQPDGWFRTTVVVRRDGDAFERGIPIETTFADGDSIRDTWEGAETSRTYAYRSRARAVSAEIDPDRMLLLDRRRGNNGVTLDTAPARTAATRWSARWMLWLEDALLTYAALT